MLWVSTLSSNAICDLCRENVDISLSHCPNCDYPLSSQREPPSASYEITDQYPQQDKIPNLGVKLADFFVNIFYLVIILTIINTIIIDSFEIVNRNGLEYLLFIDRVSPNQTSNFFNFILLHLISTWRMWLLLKIDPPDPFPEGYRTFNTILGSIIFLIIFVVIPYFILGIGLVMLITVIILIWFFVTPYKERKNPTTYSKYYSQQSKRNWTPQYWILRIWKVISGSNLVKKADHLFYTLLLTGVYPFRGISKNSSCK